MVKKDLLDVNPQWISSGRVALSGAAWGEEEPEEEPAASGKHTKGKRKMCVDDEDARSRKAARRELTEGIINDFEPLNVLESVCLSEGTSSGRESLGQSSDGMQHYTVET
jgi:hypothetical protein